MLDNSMFALVGVQELWPIAIVVLVLFGAKKLPEMARGLGEGMKEFKKAVKDVSEDDSPAAPQTVAKADTAEEIEKRIAK